MFPDVAERSNTEMQLNRVCEGQVFLGTLRVYFASARYKINMWTLEYHSDSSGALPFEYPAFLPCNILLFRFSVQHNAG